MIKAHGTWLHNNKSWLDFTLAENADKRSKNYWIISNGRQRAPESNEKTLAGKGCSYDSFNIMKIFYYYLFRFNQTNSTIAQQQMAMRNSHTRM